MVDFIWNALDYLNFRGTRKKFVCLGQPALIEQFKNFLFPVNNAKTNEKKIQNITIEENKIQNITIEEKKIEKIEKIDEKKIEHKETVWPFNLRVDLFFLNHLNDMSYLIASDAIIFIFNDINQILQFSNVLLDEQKSIAPKKVFRTKHLILVRDCEIDPKTTIINEGKKELKEIEPTEIWVYHTTALFSLFRSFSHFRLPTESNLKPYFLSLMSFHFTSSIDSPNI